MGSDVDWDALIRAQKGDTSGDKPPIKITTEACQQHIFHSAERSQKIPPHEKPSKEKE